MGKGLRGYVDVVDFTRVQGWAIDERSPDEPVYVELFDGDTLLGTAVANEWRPDLQEVTRGSGRHGFTFSYSPSLFPLARHTVHVKFAASGIEVPGSPVILEQETAQFDNSAIAWLRDLISTEVAAARSAADLDVAVEIILEQLNELVNARHRLQAQAGSPTAELLPPAPLSDRFSELVEALKATYPPLSLGSSSDQPLVSIIVPVYNKFDYTYRCVQSICTNMPLAPIEVVVVDDMSSDETMLARLVFGPEIRMVRNSANQGFIASCNAGARIARGRFLYFLNNDTEVKEGFVDELVATFERIPDLGIVGSRLLFPDGSLQEAGGIIWRMGDGWNWGRNADPNDPRFCFLRDADYVSGAALMIRKELFDELGGFDSYYAPAYYEDTDLCFRVRQAGYRVVVQPKSEVVHFEGVSSGTSTASGIKRFQLINQRKFLQRWRSVLASHRVNAQEPELEAERNVKRRALFIDDSVPTPDQDAGSNAAVEHMLAMQRLGYKVIFVPGDNMARIDPYTAALERLGIQCLYHPFHSSVEDVLRRLSVPLDLVYIHRYGNAIKYAGMVRQHYPNARLLYNLADLHHLRLERQAEVEGSRELAAKAAQIRRGEQAVMTQVDAVIVHSAVEAEIIEKQVPAASVYVVPWRIRTRPTRVPATKRSGIAFIGGYRHHPNVDAAMYICTSIMPLVRARAPHIECQLVGSHMPPELVRLAGNGVIATGWLPDLAPLFDHVRLTIAPLRFGAGIKGKVLESLAAGIPCIMSSVAAEGLELSGALRRCVADEPEQIAERIVRLHDDLKQYRAAAEEGIELIRRLYSQAMLDARLQAAITGSSADLAPHHEVGAAGTLARAV